ncbi:UNVERIFIED_CONTAM: hypothetical protein GTU68_010904 [Idotea baltica]|nr:hypothetical protein [Idotea baltica]
MPIDDPIIRIDADDEALDTVANYLSKQLGLSRTGKADFALQVTTKGLQLSQLGRNTPGPIRVDFLQGTVAHRRVFGGGKNQLIAKAVGLHKGVLPTVLDATAGLGRDAFVLASLGCKVQLIERHIIVAALLEDGLTRAKNNMSLSGVSFVDSMHLQVGDAVSLMNTWQQVPPEVIYLDPMYPHQEKSALVKKEMLLFRQLIGHDNDDSQLLIAALRLASHRVVVKRSRKAPAITANEVKVSYTLEGKSSRYDIYTLKSLTNND